MLRSRGIRLTAIVVALTVSATTSAAASTQSYSATLAPTSVPSGSRADITATIKNLDTGPATIGAVELTAPAGYTVLSATLTGAAPEDATVTFAGNSVQAHNLRIAYNETRQLRISVDTPCSPAVAAWTVVATGSRGFEDTTFSQTASALNTTTTGACRVRFAVQPANAEVGATITGSPYDPSGPPVTVELTDGAGQVRAASGLPVTMALADGSSPGPLSGTTTMNTTAGKALFTDLKVGSAGTYTLKATSGSSSTTSASATSQSFRSEQDAFVCANNQALCSVSATSADGRTRVDVNAADNPGENVDGGVLTASFNTQPSLDCAGYTERSADTAVVLGLNREKVVTLTLAASLAPPGSPQLEACVAVPYNFTPKGFYQPIPGGPTIPLGGTPTQPEVVGGQTQYKGLLPDCSSLIPILNPILNTLYPPPCVVQRSTDASGNKSIRFRLKASPLDPRTRS